MSSNEIDLVAEKKFLIDCPHMKLTPQQTGSDGKVHEGAGSVSMNKKGELSLKMYCQGTISFKEIFRLEGEATALGKIIGDEHYYHLYAKDTSINEWEADYLWLDIDGGNGSNGYIISATIKEIIFKASASSSVHQAQLFFPGKIEIPCNKWTQEKRSVGGEERLISNKLNLTEFDSCGFKFKIEPRRNGLVFSVSSNSQELHDEYLMRFVESLQFVLSRHLAWSFAKIIEGDEERIRIRSQEDNKKQLRIGSPVNMDGSFSSAWKLFNKYLNHILKHPDKKTWHPISDWVYIVIEAGTVSFDVEALLLSVTIEGLLQNGFSNVFTVTLEEKAEVKTADQIISTSELSEKLKIRIGGFLRTMLNPRAKDVLKLLKERGLIDSKFIKAYERLRNPFAHGNFSSISEPQKQLDGCLAIQVLFNQLVFLLIGYQGKYIDYSERNFPTREFFKSLSSDNGAEKDPNRQHYTEGSWLTLGVNGRISWPDEESNLTFDGHELVLRPKKKNNYPTVSILLNKIDKVEARKVLNQFLSILSWIDGQSAELKYGLIGCCPLYVGQENFMSSIKPSWAFEGFKRAFPKDSKQRLALGLYREAVTVNSMPYQFLSFYKVICVCLGENKETKHKINELISKIIDERAIERIKDLTTQGKDIGEYLYAEKRTAIAHVTHDPIINPDELDGRIFYNDIRLVKALAEYLIENELKISKNFWLIG